MDSSGEVTFKLGFANQRHSDNEEKYVEIKLGATDNEKKPAKDFAEFLQKQRTAGAEIWVELPH
jgi:hypothetical protein